MDTLLTRWMHHTTDDKSTDSAAGKMQARPFVHAEVSDQSPFGEKVGGQLDAATKTCPDHSCTNTSIKASDTFVVLNLSQTINGVFILMLCPNRQEGGIRL